MDSFGFSGQKREKTQEIIEKTGRKVLKRKKESAETEGKGKKGGDFL